MLAALGIVAAQEVIRADSPGQINFQARLTDSTGKSLPDGTVAQVAFQLFSDPGAVGSSFLWGEAQTNVAISRGIISVRLGNGNQAINYDFSTASQGPNPLLAGLFDGNIRYMRIRVNNDPPLSPLIALVSVPYALSAGSLNGKTETQLGSPPIGAVIDWYRPNAQAVVPDGWHVCDGSTISDAASPFNGLSVPDLRNVFVRGLDPTRVNAGNYAPGLPFPDAGGNPSVNLAHAHNVAAHSHSISTDGTHQHSGATSPPIDDTTFFDVQGGSLYNTSTHHHTFTTNSAGAHNHSGATGAAGSVTDAQLGAVSIIPPYVGLLKIIRIK